jgi:hypothetical protein
VAGSLTSRGKRRLAGQRIAETRSRVRVVIVRDLGESREKQITRSDWSTRHGGTDFETVC